MFMFYKSQLEITACSSQWVFWFLLNQHRLLNMQQSSCRDLCLHLLLSSTRFIQLVSASHVLNFSIFKRFWKWILNQFLCWFIVRHCRQVIKLCNDSRLQMNFLFFSMPMHYCKIHYIRPNVSNRNECSQIYMASVFSY